MAAKPTYDEYLQDFVKELDGGEYSKANKTFEYNMRNAVQALINSSEFSAIVDCLNKSKLSYSDDRPELLFNPADAPNKISILYKPFDSALDKCFRRNVTYNRKYPDPPSEGFIAPKEIFEKIDDLLRARIVCKYMDGPEHVCNELAKACEANAIEYMYRDVGTDAGYYAWHFYFKFDAELVVGGAVEPRKLTMEIQVTTQLAEVITVLTHELYQERRAGRNHSAGSRWKWDSSSNRFRSAYLGHGLHLLEGIIQELKNDLVKSANEVGTVGEDNGMVIAIEAVTAVTEDTDEDAD